MPRAPKSTTKTERSASTAKPYIYDRPLVVQLVVQSSKPQWEVLASEIGKTATQCKDVWRKILLPALVGGRPWAADGAGWSGEMKRQTVMRVVSDAQPNWDAIAAHFEGRTRSRASRRALNVPSGWTDVRDLTTDVYDLWRKILLPRLRNGLPLA
ncbi:hypothetical protein Q5752_002927 [Cryptotrichosporon argae]